jgi:hypothetical protein
MLKDKVYNEYDMKGSIQKVLSSISAKELQFAKNVFVRCVHLHVVLKSKNLLLTAKYYTNSLEHL